MSALTLLSILVGVMISSGQGDGGLICRAGRGDTSIWDSDNGRAKAGLDIGLGPRPLICAFFGR